MQLDCATAPRRGRTPTVKANPIPWQQKPFQTVGDFTEIFGVSAATAYRLGREKKIELVNIAGRTMITTDSVIAFAKTATPWTPSKRGEGGRRKRAENTAQRWR